VDVCRRPLNADVITDDCSRAAGIARRTRHAREGIRMM